MFLRDYIPSIARNHLEGHDVCSGDPWVNGSRDQPGKAVALHPFEEFHEAVAKRIVALLEKG